MQRAAVVKFSLILCFQTILLTGGSEGTGLSAARIFSSKGAHVIILSRDPVKLEAALQSIKAAAKSPNTQRFHSITADVGTPNYSEEVISNATAWNNGQPPDIIWCLAGLSTPMLWTDERAMEAARYNSELIPHRVSTNNAYLRLILPRQ